MLLSLSRCLKTYLCMLMVSQAFGQEPKATDVQVAEPSAKAPIKAMIVTGGCCHDYRFQSEAIMKAFQESNVNVEWTVIHQGGTGTEAEIDLYDDPKWADGFDVVIHNECFANTKNADYIRRITSAHHQGVNAVVVHCAMHTYRSVDIDDWRQFLGVTSRRHDHQSNYKIDVTQPDHAIMKDFPADHKSAKDELYIIEKVWPNTTVLATSTSEKDGSKHPVFWTNQFGKARVFGTTYGHSSETFQDPVFLRAFVQGTKWASGR
jgi:uncharacterized protein